MHPPFLSLGQLVHLTLLSGSLAADLSRRDVMATVTFASGIVSYRRGFMVPGENVKRYCAVDIAVQT
jgi:hypothetical protein